MKWWQLAGAVVVTGATAVVAVALGGTGADRPGIEEPTSEVVTMSGPQFLLNWQSFPGREVLVRFCTIRAVVTRGTSCLVFDGARRLGEIEIENETFDLESRTWADKNCTGVEPSVRCSIRLSGFLKKKRAGSPVIVRGKVLL